MSYCILSPRRSCAAAILGNGLCGLRVLLCLLVFAPAVLRSEDWAYQSRCTFLAANTYDTEKTFYVCVNNPTASSIVFRYSTAGAEATAVDQNIDSTISLGTFTISGVTYTTRLRTGSTPVTVGAGVTTYIPFKFTVQTSPPGGAGNTAVSVGSKVWTFSVPYYEDHSRKTASLSRTCLVSSNQFTCLLTGSGTGNVIPAGGSPAGSPMAGTVYLGAPATATGTIDVTGIHGNYHARLLIGGTVVAECDNVPSPVTDQTTVGPGLSFSTATPATFLGATCVVEINGQTSNTFVITGDVYGNFNYDFDALPYEYPQRVTDEEGTELPTPGTDALPEMDEDDEHTRPGIAIPGTDPSGDTTVDSDGAGPGTGLSVKDIYRATRAAFEDANHDPNPGGNFNFDAWRGTDTPAENPQGQGFGSALGDGLGGMQAAAGGTGGFGGMSGISGPFVVMVGGYAMTVPVVAASTWIRTFLLLFLLIFFWQAVVHTIRGGFAGK